MLKIQVNLEFPYASEIPVSISGKLCHQNGKILSVLTEYELNSDNDFGLTLKTEQEKKSKENDQNRHNIQLSALLSSLVIQSIEEQREKTKNKSVEFYIEFIVKTLNQPASLDNLQGNDLVRLNIERKHSRIKVEQSDWVTNFAPKLGIGSFLLLELNVAENNVSDFWKDLTQLLKSSILEMERNIRLGEWKKTIEYSRQFFDGLNIKNNRNTDAPFEKKLKEVLIAEQHNEEGINNLLKAIKSLFDFTSKYVHPKDRSGIVKPYPNAGKEDAYLVYTLSIGLFNLINSKILK
ncbi:hypothetical protein [uncultured Marixanthomonas sp.]|uniref:hypothetical protein n=1 Tax=uncultured Marixanthomonas sp. TaxID=757245 RepID=UPI0030D83E90|tara:strand:+ start:87 stop:965 length:879 start_codon:yes stop_codon:yes gene_type:complete